MNHSQRSREKDIAQYIGQFPSEELLKLAKTEDQQKFWGHLAALYLAASRCWIAKLEGKDPLLEAVENRVINKWYYDALWAKVNKLQSLWKLIDSGHELIFAAFIKAYPDPKDRYPFIGAPDLFSHIVKTEANNTFAICLKPYHHVSNPHRIKAGKIVRQLISTGAIKPQQRNFLKSLASQYRHNRWLLVSLAIICEAAESGNRGILKKLEDYRAAAIQDMEVTLTGLSRTRSSRNFEKFYSFVWKDGQIFPAINTGGIYPIL